MIIFCALVATLAVCGHAVRQDTDEVDIFPYIVKDLYQLKIRQHDEGRRQQDDPLKDHGTSVCYDDLGCFDVNGTFKHLKQLPDTPENVATRFLLYTRKNPHTPKIVDYTKPETIVNSNIDPKLPLKFIIHGFGGKNNITWMWNMKNAFLTKENLNVIAVDWSKGAAIPHYINAAVNAELVGAQIAALFYVIKERIGIQEKDLHVIGFSLGAHVSGFVGKRMRKLGNTKPGRITGLDPASPLYEDEGKEVHLYKDDADFVDVIHTNADMLIYGGVGIGVPIGHVDYYPNGGLRQPGCPSTIKGAFLDLLMKGKRDRVCNHERAVHLFTESILKPEMCDFSSYPCDSFEQFQKGTCFACKSSECGVMGYYPQGQGVHYLITDQEAPYCSDAAILNIQFSKENEKSYGSIVIFLIGRDGEKINVTLTKKDEKLMPSENRMIAIAVKHKMKPIKEVQVMYTKYSGWFSKGTDTFTIGTISLSDSRGLQTFKACGDHILKDKEIENFPQSEDSC